jgi:hypothetical protein
VPPMLAPWALRLIGHIVVGADVRKLNGMYVDDDLVAADSGGNLQGFIHAFCHGPVIGNCFCNHSWRGTWVSMRNKVHKQCNFLAYPLLSLPFSFCGSSIYDIARPSHPSLTAHASCLPPSLAMSNHPW